MNSWKLLIIVSTIMPTIASETVEENRIKVSGTTMKKMHTKLS